MNITKVNVRPFNGKGSLVAFADITIDDNFKITSFKVIDGSKGLFIGMPAVQGKDKEGNPEWKDIAFPLNKDARKELEKVILDEYRKASNKTGTTKTSNRNDDLPF